MTDDFVTFDFNCFEPLLSGYLAALTDEYGMGNCFKRAKAAMNIAPRHLRQRLQYVEGTLRNAVGLEPYGAGEHGWLMMVDSQGYSIIDPTIGSYILDGGEPSEMRWLLPSAYFLPTNSDQDTAP